MIWKIRIHTSIANPLKSLECKEPQGLSFHAGQLSSLSLSPNPTHTYAREQKSTHHLIIIIIVPVGSHIFNELLRIHRLTCKDISE